MIEVCCHSADLSVSNGLAVSVEVELDGFVVGRTQPCAVEPGSRARPRWEDRFPVMGTGHVLIFRVMDPNVVGESQVDLQAWVCQQQEGQQSSLALIRQEMLVGTIWASVQPLTSPSRSTAQSLPEHLQIVRQGSSYSESPGSANLRSPAARRLGCLAFPSRAGQRSPIPCGGSAPRVSSPSPAVRSLLEERRPAPLGQAALTPSGPQASGTPSTGTNRFKADLDSARHSQISGASPASCSTARASPNAPRPARSRSSLSAGSEKSPGSRLNFTEKAQRDLVELMRSKDKLRAYAERPFKVPGRSLLAGNRLCFEDFQHALKELLQELHISVPADKQMQALFDKHRGSNPGVSSEDFEALLFRLLCFLRASEEVRVNPGAEIRSCSEERDKRWRQDFIQTNSQKFHEVYEVQKQLGKGSFGTVYLVSHRTQVDQNKAKRVRVCKMISKAKAKEAMTSEAKVREEFAVLKQLDHPHVLRIFEDFEDEKYFYLVMEQCRGGDLAEYVKCLEPMDAQSYEFWVAKVMQHTLSAIAYCHSKAVIHKDLKPENVMLSTTRDTPVAQMHVVVVDFGLAEVFARSTDRSDVVSGTPPYMAPEVWQGNFSKSCDVWSAGCMLFFLLSGRLPFVAATVKEFPKALRQEPDWAAMGGATHEAQQICRQMLQKKEHQRPTAQSCLKDRWFVQMGLAGHSNPAGVLNDHQLRSLLAVGQRSEFEKFVTRFVATQLDASQQTKVNEAFKAFDADGDGHLSAEELRQGLMQFGAHAEQAEQVVNELDVGRTGQVSYTEFLAGVINLRCKTPEEQDRLLWIAWAQFRPDINGLVKVQDIQNALATRGMTVADMPDGFLAALTKDHTQYISFNSFKSLLFDGGQMASAEERGRGAKFMRWIMQAVR